MGCSSSKDIKEIIKKQNEKIDNLVQINENLRHKINELPMNSHSDGKHANETADLTNLKTTIDSRFNKLERNVEKIHNDLRNKLFEGVVDNLGDRNDQYRPNDSLSLNFEREAINKNNDYRKNSDDAAWKDLLNDTNTTANRIVYEHIYMQDEPGLTKYLANGNMRVSTNPEEKDRVSQRKGSNHDVYSNSGKRR